jgi:hypothetical protein
VNESILTDSRIFAMQKPRINMGWFKSREEKDFEYLIDRLLSLRIKNSDLTSEKNVENIIVDRIRKDFPNIHQQFNIEVYIA